MPSNPDLLSLSQPAHYPRHHLRCHPNSRNYSLSLTHSGWHPLVVPVSSSFSAIPLVQTVRMNFPFHPLFTLAQRAWTYFWQLLHWIQLVLVFLPHTPHGSTFASTDTSFPILHSKIFILPRFTFNPFLSKADFQIIEIIYHKQKIKYRDNAKWRLYHGER